jgi:hypothetical protein
MHILGFIVKVNLPGTGLITGIADQLKRIR